MCECGHLRVCVRAYVFALMSVNVSVRVCLRVWIHMFVCPHQILDGLFFLFFILSLAICNTRNEHAYFRKLDVTNSLFCCVVQINSSCLDKNVKIMIISSPF